MTSALVQPKALAVWFADLIRWDIKSARAVQFSRDHPTFSPLGEFAEEVTELVRPWEEPDREWPVYGVNNNAGVFFSHRQKGELFNAPYKRIRRDWFFHNPTRANVGSLGRVSDVPHDAITSPEYQVWRICTGVTPGFMEVLLRMPFFKMQIEHHRVGAVKERLFTQNLLEIRIPVLSEPTQVAIVAHWRKAHEVIVKARDTVAKLEAEIQNEIFKALGMKPPQTDRPLRKAFALWWKGLERWSVDFLARSALSRSGSKSSFSMTTLGVIAQISYGIQKCPANRPGKHPRPYLRVANVQRGGLDLREIKYIDVPDSELETFRLSPGDLLVCEGNSADLVGRPAIWNGEIPDCVHQNHVLRVRVAQDKALPEFVLEYMSTFYARAYFRSRAKFTTNLASINSNDLRGLPLPLPPLLIQREIVDAVNLQRARIAKEREAAEQRQAEATREMEEMILGVRPVG